MNMLVRNRMKNLPFFGNLNNELFLGNIDKLATEFFEKDEGFIPASEVTESKEFYTIAIELPGMELSEIEVTLKEKSIAITGEKKTSQKENEEKYYHSERKYGKFQKEFTLGDKVDREKIKANMKNGILNIVLGKTEKSALTPKKIEITEE